MDFINWARRGSANKEQVEKSCIVSHNNFIFIDNFRLFCKQWLFVMLMSKWIFYRQGKNRPKVPPEQLQHNGNFTEATAAEINHGRVCTFTEVSAVYRFCFKPNLTILKSFMMLSRSSIMVLCFGRDLFPRVSLHEDLHTHSTHCMQIILKTRFQFPQWVMKNILFPKVITIFKMKQILPGFCVTCFTSAFASASFSARLQGVVLLDWDNLFIPTHFQRLITGKLTGVDPGRRRNLQRRKDEVTSWPK